MNARDELAEIIAQRYHAVHAGATVLDGAIADAILAAGFRKPRTITTAEERATLLPGTICADLNGNAWKRGTGSWASTGGDTAPLYDEDDLTLTVLHEPRP